MERLTKPNTVNNLNKYMCKELDMTCTFADCDTCNHMHEIVDKLGHYEDLAEQGRLVELPCKIGDTIYKIPSEVNYKLNVVYGHQENNRVYEQVVCSIKICPSVYLLETCDGQDCVIEQFFKESWFLTKSEAEQTLAERKE